MNDDLGGVVALMTASPIHERWYIGDVSRLILAPLMLGQAVVVRGGRGVIAFASWALFDEIAEDGYLAGDRKIQESDWRSGDRLWLVDVVSPYGATRELLASLHDDLRRRGFAGRRIRFRRITMRGQRRYSEVRV